MVLATGSCESTWTIQQVDRWAVILRGRVHADEMKLEPVGRLRQELPARRERVLIAPPLTLLELDIRPWKPAVKLGADRLLVPVTVFEASRKPEHQFLVEDRRVQDGAKNVLVVAADLVVAEGGKVGRWRSRRDADPAAGDVLAALRALRTAQDVDTPGRVSAVEPSTRGP